MVKTTRLMQTCILLFCTVLFITQASANFVCGEVLDRENISGAWMNVRAYYPPNPQQYTTCLVSGANNRYCCDPLDIKGSSWAIGKNISARIIESETGYFADAVTLTASGEGYDVFEPLRLTKAITVHEPTRKIYVNSTSISVNVSLAEPYTNLKYTLASADDFRVEQVCTQCSTAFVAINNLSYGKHNLTLEALNQGESMFERMNIVTLKSIDFSRRFNCGWCSGNYIHSGETVEVIVTANLSDSADGELTDYFPRDWEYISGGEVKPFSMTHNKVVWNVSGSNIVQSYVLRSPKTLFPRRYSFMSDFEGYSGVEDSATVFWYFKLPFSISQPFSSTAFSALILKQYPVVSPSTPMVLTLSNDSDIENVLVHAEYPSKNAFVALSDIRVQDEAPEGTYRQFVVITNVIWIERVGVSVKAPLNTGIDEIDLYHSYTGDQWSRTELELSSIDEKYVYYRGYANSTGIFAIAKNEP